MIESTTESISQNSDADILSRLTVCQSLLTDTRSTTVNVAMALPGFGIVADFDFGGKRALDVLNDPLTEFLDCENAKLFQGGELVDEMERSTIGKAKIIAAAILGDLHEAPQKRRNHRRQLSQFPAIVATNDLVIRGSVHAPTKTPVRVFLNGESGYFAVQKASVLNLQGPGVRTQAQVALVNRARVSAMEIKTCAAASSAWKPLI